MQLGTAAVGRADEISARGPAERTECRALDAERGRWRSGLRQWHRPRRERAGAEVGDERERAVVRRDRERRAAREPPRRVRDRHDALAWLEVGDRPYHRAA